MKLTANSVLKQMHKGMLFSRGKNKPQQYFTCVRQCTVILLFSNIHCIPQGNY